MKRWTVWILSACLLLSGCGVIQDSKGVGQEVPVSSLDLSGIDSLGSTKKAAVYFLNSTSRTLTADLRLLNIRQDANPAAAAVEALLDGPANSSLTAVAPDGMTLDFIEFSNGMANVYLKYDGLPMTLDNQYIMELAIANTVADLLGATSINIFYNGIRQGFQGYASAPLKKQSVSVDEAFANAKAKYLPAEPVAEADSTVSASPTLQPEPTSQVTVPEEPKTAEISTVLYFISSSGDFLLPEVRPVSYTTTSTSDNYISAIFNELKAGPKNTDVMRSPVESGASLVGDPVIINNEDGTKDIELHFDLLPANTVYAGSNDMLLSYAALVYSITGFVPGVRAVHIFVGNAKVPLTTSNGDDGTKRSDFFGYIGSSAPLYFQYANSGLLLEVSRSMEQGKTWSALMRVRELMRGPQMGDGNNVSAVQITGMTESDILSVNVYGDTAYVDLSANFKASCRGLSDKNEMLLVYAIVNTVTAMDGINRVQFLVEGQQTDTLAGHLCISDAFIKNYGIIKNGS